MTKQEIIDKLRSAHETLDGLKGDSLMVLAAGETRFDETLDMISETIDDLRKRWDLP